MNQPNDCPRFISEVAHERVVGELNRTIARLTTDAKESGGATIEFGVAAIELKRDLEDRDRTIAELAVSLAQSESRGDTLRAALTLTTQTRDGLAADMLRVKQERNEFAKAWGQALAEQHQLALELGTYKGVWDKARVERDEFEKEYTGAIEQNTHLRKLFVTMHELLKQGGAA